MADKLIFCVSQHQVLSDKTTNYQHPKLHPELTVVQFQVFFSIPFQGYRNPPLHALGKHDEDKMFITAG